MWRGLVWFSQFCWELRVYCSFLLEGVEWMRIGSSGGVSFWM